MRLNIIQRIILILFCTTIIVICILVVPFVRPKIEKFIGYYPIYANIPPQNEAYSPTVDFHRLSTEIIGVIIFYGGLLLAFSGETKKK